MHQGSNDSEEGKKSLGQKAQKDLFGVVRAVNAAGFVHVGHGTLNPKTPKH